MGVLLWLYRRTRLIVALALLAIGLAIYFAAAPPIKDLGLALATAMVAGLSIDILFRDDLLAEVGRSLNHVETTVGKLHDSLPRVLHPLLERLMDATRLFERLFPGLSGATAQQAQGSGVSGIYLRGNVDLVGTHAIWGAIEKQLQLGQGKIRVIGVAAPSLFGAEPSARHLFQRYMPDSQCVIEALLLDEKCDWADIRSALERGPGTLTDIRGSNYYLEQMAEDYGDDRVQHLSLDFPPPAFVVITDEHAFVEPYPLAPVTGALGGLTAMYVHDRGSEGYNIWNQTFDFLWNGHHQVVQLRQFAEEERRRRGRSSTNL